MQISLFQPIFTSQKHFFLDIGRPCNLLISIMFQIYISERPTQHPVRSKTQQFQLIYTGVISKILGRNVYLITGNRQNWKIITVIRQFYLFIVHTPHGGHFCFRSPTPWIFHSRGCLSYPPAPWNPQFP